MTTEATFGTTRCEPRHVVRNPAEAEATLSYVRGAPEVAEDDAQSAELSTQILDLSRNGVRVRSAESIPAGTRLRIRIRFLAAGIEHISQGVVRWSLPRTTSEWWIGCSTDDSIGDEIVDQLATVDLLERRRDTRIQVSYQATAKWALSFQAFGIEIVDYSLSGCRIVCEQLEDDVDRMLLILSEDCPDTGSSRCDRLPVHIKWKQCVDGNWVYGCEYITNDSYLRLRSYLSQPSHDVVDTRPVSRNAAVRWKWIAAAAIALLAVVVGPDFLRKFHRDTSFSSPQSVSSADGTEDEKLRFVADQEPLRSDPQ